MAGLLWSAAYANLTIGSHDVDGAVMPPGMIMTRDTPAEAMRDMAAVDPDDVRYIAPADARGDQPLEPRIEDGVKVFDLETSVIEWNILPDVQVMAYAFNRQVPGPRMRVTEGDRIRINVTNHLPESTTRPLARPDPAERDGRRRRDHPGADRARARPSPTSSRPRSAAPTSTTPTITSTGSRRWGCTAR